jgi:chorismate-pyruvate lyase
MTAGHAPGRSLADGGAPPFDPAADVFVAQASRPACLAPVDLAALTPLQRGLLVIDGTVTKFLEASALEPIEVVRLDQAIERLAAADPWLDVAAGAGVIRRRVMLRGLQSGRFYVWADSLIAIERLSATVRRAIEQDGGGLGQILIDTAAETRREGLWYGRERCADVPPRVRGLWAGEFLSRSYRVLAGARPMMVITERFPLAGC